MNTYTQEEVQVLRHIIEEKHGQYGFRGYRLTKFVNLEEFHKYLRLNSNLNRVLQIPFNKLPVVINKEKLLTNNENWFSSVITWRFQIGK